MKDTQKHYDFKVGDEVINSRGSKGVIIEICNCDRCKDRGFLEPQVTNTLGADYIYITDLDKSNGFSNYYKIGEYMFGNIDEASVISDIKNTTENIRELEKRLYDLKCQLRLINQLKGVKNHTQQQATQV